MSEPVGRLIGNATMDNDGVVTLDLRAEMEHGVGLSRLVYPPSHPRYQMILDHLGGLAPGEIKGVLPFPDESADEGSTSTKDAGAR